MDKNDNNSKSAFIPNNPTPVPDDMPVLYVTIRDRDCENENWADRHPDTVVPGTGWRFMTYDIPSHDEGIVFDDRHRDGYNYGFTRVPYKSVSGFWGEDPWELSTLMFKVRLKYANDIYVVDEAPFLEMREQKRDEREAAGKEDKDVAELECNQIFGAIAATITPLSEYKGGFQKPIYLIGRPLGAEEAIPFVPAFKQKLINEDIARRNRPNPALDALFSDLAAPEDKPEPMPEVIDEDVDLGEVEPTSRHAKIIPFRPK